MDQNLQEVNIRCGQAAREIENKPEVTLRDMPTPSSEQLVPDEPFPNRATHPPDQRAECAQGGQEARTTQGGQQTVDPAEAELARFLDIVDQRVHGLTNWANRSKDALQETPDKM